MNFKYLTSSIAIGIGLFCFAEIAQAEVVVEWQAGDNSVNIQRAIDSGEDTVIIPNSNLPWIVGDRIIARQPNQKIIFEEILF